MNDKQDENEAADGQSHLTAVLGFGDSKGASLSAGLGVDAMTKLIRFSLSRNEADDIEIFSCETQTMLILPKNDVQLLIDSLMSLDQMSLPRETVSLDLSS